MQRKYEVGDRVLDRDNGPLGRGAGTVMRFVRRHAGEDFYVVHFDNAASDNDSRIVGELSLRRKPQRKGKTC